MKLVKILLFTKLCFLCLNILAQNNTSPTSSSKALLRKIRNQKKEDSQRFVLFAEGKISYKYHYLLGVGLATDGYKSFFEFAYKPKNPKFGIMLFSIDLISERTHPKEKKIESPYRSTDERTKYIYRKNNIFHLINLSYGQQYQLGNLFHKKAVSVNGYFKTGLSLAFLRPYYLKVLDFDTIFNQTYFRHVRYSEESQADFLNQNIIFASSKLQKGWDELNIVPGLHIELGVRMYFLPKLKIKSLLGVEAAFVMDVYTEKIDIMIPSPITPASRYFIGGSFSVLFGGRK